VRNRKCKYGNPSDNCRHRRTEQGQHEIIEAVNMVTNQASQVTQATKEQAASVENIVKGVANAREQVRQVTVAVKEQAKQGQNIITAVENVNNQAAQVTQATKERQKVLKKSLKVWQMPENRYGRLLLR